MNVDSLEISEYFLIANFLQTISSESVAASLIQLQKAQLQVQSQLSGVSLIVAAHLRTAALYIEFIQIALKMLH